MMAQPRISSVRDAAALGPLDPRDHGWREDLADIALADRIAVPHYAAPAIHHLTAQRATLSAKRSLASVAVSELLHGERFAVLDVHEGFAWGYGLHDGYVGYVPMAALGMPHTPPETRIGPADALLFADASIKAPVADTLPAGAWLATVAEDERFHRVTGGPYDGLFLHRRHILPAGRDWVETACVFVGAPYRWGGRTRSGVDCSGLVQMARMLSGHRTRRDSDMQAADTLPVSGTRQRGDLACWPGHIGILLDADRLLHANAHAMRTLIEPLADVEARAGQAADIRRWPETPSYS